tara:strand:- start:108 stop:566 length:459 start_codon:yes stop_codon:yes gene_type:complete
MKQITNQDSVSAFSITLANATNAVISFRMFDADGVVNAIQGARNVTATGTITPSVIYSTCVANPIVVSGFNYESSVKTAQFAQPFDILRGSIDGRIVKHPNIIAKAKRNTQFDSLLLTIDERFIIDSQTAVEVSVASTNDVTLTFFVEGFLS